MRVSGIHLRRRGYRRRGYLSLFAFYRGGNRGPGESSHSSEGEELKDGEEFSSG
ncbi:unnamed protein product [Gulo gulo]|uniref:Uncharacterized protein n=1 Tax=Gulo gulo TaxID=48420 RepID=A0A9X9LLI8_GULGU|nr:unnamed protein product [Gulo gulo]